MADHEEAHFDAQDTEKLITAISNNAPDCLPDAHLSANRKRRFLRNQNLTLARGATLTDAPIAGLPEAVNPHLEVFSRKMLAAMFYRESGRILSSDSALILSWAQLGTKAAIFSRSKAEEWFGEERKGSRSNTNIGTQYSYKFGYHPNHGFFGLWMEFGKSFGFFLIAGPSEKMASLKDQGMVRNWEPMDIFSRSVRDGLR